MTATVHGPGLWPNFEEPDPLPRLGRIIHEAKILGLEAKDMQDERLWIAALAMEHSALRQWERLVGINSAGRA